MVSSRPHAISLAIASDIRIRLRALGLRQSAVGQGRIVVQVLAEPFYAYLLSRRIFSYSA